MKITKFAHSCLLIEERGARIIIDPGNYSTKQNTMDGIDAVLITHEHQDHCDVTSVKAILGQNPNAKVFTNKGVGVVLDKEGIKYSTLKQGESTAVNGVKIDAFGEKHAMIYSTWPIVDNTGYMIADKLFHPGDAFTLPAKKVEVLALPLTAPWCKISETVDYAKAVKADTCFPIHDASLKTPTFLQGVAQKLIEPSGTKFVGMDIDSVADF